jgi:hypothetical protein
MTTDDELQSLRRRDVLRKVGAAGAGAVALAAAAASPASAAPGDPMIVGAPNDAAANTTGLKSSAASVLLVHNTGDGVAVAARTSGAPAIEGRSSGSSAGAVRGVSTGTNAVEGIASQFGVSGVYGTHTAEGHGVAGDSSASGFPGVLGRNNGSGNGVTGTSIGGTGVRGLGGWIGVHGVSTTNTGVVAEGRVPLRLVPGTTVGPPVAATHFRGEVFVDNVGDLYLCTAGGNPGTWRKVALV